MPINSFDDYYMSWKPDKSKLGFPLYKGLADQMEKDITEGFLLPGTKLPPQRELADFLDINLSTVTKAYRLAEYKGLIQGFVGSGTFVSPTAADSITIVNEEVPPGGIEMGLALSFPECNTLITPAMQSILDHPIPSQFLNYKTPAGMPHQLHVASQWLKQFDVECDIEDLFLMNGSGNALAICLLALFDPGDRIAVDQFCFSNFMELAKLNNLILVPVAGDANGMLPEELDLICKKNTVRGIFLMPSLANPTTVVMKDNRRERLARIIEKHDLILIEDDADAFLTFGHISSCTRSFRTLLPENTVYVSSGSKPICSGIRASYLVTPKKYNAAFRHAIFNANIKTSSLESEILTQAIVTGLADEIRERKIELAKEANALFNEFFPDAPQYGHPFPFFRWLPLPRGTDPNAFSKELLDDGVLVLSSSRFVCDKSVNDKFLRVSLSSAGCMENLKIGLGIIAEHIDRTKKA